MKSIVEFLVNNRVQQQKKSTEIEVITDIRKAKEDDLYKLEYGQSTMIGRVAHTEDKGNAYRIYTKWTAYSIDKTIRLNNECGFMKVVNKLLPLTDAEVEMVREIEFMYDNQFANIKEKDKEVGTYKITGDNITITWE